MATLLLQQPLEGQCRLPPQHSTLLSISCPVCQEEDRGGTMLSKMQKQEGPGTPEQAPETLPSFSANSV